MLKKKKCLGGGEGLPLTFPLPNRHLIKSKSSDKSSSITGQRDDINITIPRKICNLQVTDIDYVVFNSLKILTFTFN